MSHTLIWIAAVLLGTVALRTIFVGYGVVRFAAAQRVPLKHAWAVAAALTTWIALVGLLGFIGMFEITWQTKPPPRIALAALLPLLTFTIAYFSWGSFRRVIVAVPLTWLLGIHVYRISIGSFFYLWHTDQLPGVFALPVATGDVLMGVSGVLLAVALYRGTPWALGAAKIWSALGIVELLAFIPLGLLTTPSPMQLLAFDVPNRLTTIWPLVLAPTCYVPFAIFLHIVTLDKIRMARAKDGETHIVVSTAARNAGPITRPPLSTSWAVLTTLSTLVAIYAFGAYLLVPKMASRPIAFHIHPLIGATLQAREGLTLTHIISAAIALALGPWQLLGSFRRARPQQHKRMGLIYTLAVVVSALAGLLLAQSSFAGPSSRWGFSLLAVAWLVTLVIAVRHILGGRRALHRAWMIRNFSLTLAGVTLRLVNLVAFKLGYELPDFHWINAWLCWVPNLVVAEAYLRMRPARNVGILSRSPT